MSEVCNTNLYDKHFTLLSISRMTPGEVLLMVKNPKLCLSLARVARVELWTVVFRDGLPRIRSGAVMLIIAALVASC